jgi:hypothetical protein
MTSARCCSACAGLLPVEPQPISRSGEASQLVSNCFLVEIYIDRCDVRVQLLHLLEHLGIVDATYG